jgi:NTP pyrophosphatase (non-canonical NTP hydrolase)
MEEDQMKDVLTDVAVERARQDLKWGPQNHSPALWLSILTEEVGEVATEVQDMAFRDKLGHSYRAELIQVAAVAVAMIESYDRSRA